MPKHEKLVRIITSIRNGTPPTITVEDAYSVLIYEDHETTIVRELIRYNKLDCLRALQAQDPEQFTSGINMLLGPDVDPTNGLVLLLETMLAGGIDLSDRQDLISFLIMHGSDTGTVFYKLKFMVENMSLETHEFEALILFLKAQGMIVPEGFYTSNEALQQLLLEFQHEPLPSNQTQTHDNQTTLVGCAVCSEVTSTHQA
jgi:hypothetical protein